MPGPGVRLALVGERNFGIEEVIESLSGLKDVGSLTPELLQAELDRKKSQSRVLVWCEAGGVGLRNRDKQISTLLEKAGGTGIIARCSDRLARQLEESDTGENPFLLLRAPNLPGERATSNKAAMRRELNDAISVIDSIQVPSDVPMSDDVRQWLAQLAVFVTRLRTPVPRDIFVEHSPRYGFRPADDFHLLFALAARRLAADEYPSAHQQLA